MTNVYDLSGKVGGKVDLPKVFKTDYRPDLIQRAVVSMQASRRQPYGTDVRAGLRTSADYFGNRHHSYRLTMNRGMSRLPREKPGGGGLGKVRIVPHSVGGRRAHGPNKNKIHAKKMNNREYDQALQSSIAATADKNAVIERGHKLGKISELPMVVVDDFQALKKTKDVLKALTSLGFTEDLERGAEKSVRAGKGTMRGRKYKKRKSILIVLNEDNGVVKAASNIPGVDVASIKDLNVELLAPGTHAGRLTLWTKSAIENIAK